MGRGDSTRQVGTRSGKSLLDVDVVIRLGNRPSQINGWDSLFIQFYCSII